MKTRCTIILAMMLLSSTSVWAQKKKHTDSVDVTINLKKRFTKNASVDSVFIFFDRFNHTGAGIIKKVYYPQNNKVVVMDVPPGKYYIGIFCMGTHLQYFSEVTFVNKRRSNQLQFRLDRSETFIPGSYIPLADFDFSKLAITSPKTFK